MKRTRNLAAVSVAGIIGLVGVFALASLNRGDESNKPTATRVIAGDVDYASSVDHLVSRSSLVVFGVPIGKPSFTVQTETGLLGDYLQSVRVIDVLRGDAPREIQVVRMGLDAEKAKDTVHSDTVGGPLPTRPVVLFLQPSARPDAYAVVGHTQGTLIFGEGAENAGANARSEALEHAGFDELRGLTIEELKARVTP